MGLMIKTKYNNFIEPAIYDNSTQKQAFVDFLANINVFREEREKTPYTEDDFKYEDNQAINKKVLAEYRQLVREAVNG